MGRPPNPIKVHRCGFVLDEPLYAKLVQLAEQDKRSVSTAVRMLLEAALTGNPPIVNGHINGSCKT